MEKPNLTIASSPHIRSSESVQSVMRDVLIALAPAAIASIYFFRTGAIINIISSIVGAVLAEYLMQKILKKPITINDLSAVVTGLLLAFNVPASAPWWMTFVGGFFAIAVAKQLFGGLGMNFMNPALVARALLLASWPVQMTAWTLPITKSVDIVSTSTPLAFIKQSDVVQRTGIMDMFLGNIPGSLGETSALLLILGGIYLIYRGVITYVIPAVYILTVAILAYAFSGFDSSMIMYNVFGGGLMLGAFFMATDYATSPLTVKGQIIYAFGCGLLTSVIRYFGGYPEGVSYSILLMNVCTPLIERQVRPRVFGEVKKNEK
ncbi:RnfABCDGE type electron transport complex subunit D [Criibacterium bergeronii]|uniref:Ion-translocating oxidoreductase complex subunit D n=1 Tax=Criibacterium bergeronii TaxID=1871336 RepID=A0A371IMU2_9FIRM|nr:RnfABCDGE type electron transport complex subunit D [Criibacterium bergeronii]MBS6063919.1 RnfABCDGE type electron transport complex subunit D [Peptostreptococcaceae bacterium]RDY21791.1 RnfABCDGE type electron transport complex subunit D [Criibacterium bergeronii]TRW24553.1 RnfABCDGE type electron transport complex subunit D [Criibacterium bergeronii]